jgi:hypothetical protein
MSFVQWINFKFKLSDLFKRPKLYDHSLWLLKSYDRIFIVFLIGNR